MDQLESTRLVDSRTSWKGTYTLWKTYGAQYQLRKNGYPLGVISAYPEAIPQYSGEIFRTVFPLIMHENPETVLIQGNGTGLSLKTALSFPVKKIDCYEDDTELLDLLRKNVWTNKYLDVEQDKRVSIKTINPYLSTLLKGKKYDVIVSNPPESSFLNASSCFTKEYYQSIQHRLSSEGLFCQYFRAVEYGYDPVKTIFNTFQKGFQESFAVEVGANEYLLIGTNSESGLIRKDLINRLQAKHVREVLSMMGWDWSVPLSLRVYQLDKLNYPKAVAENRISDNCFAFLSPGEVVRWGNKPKEILEILAPASVRVVDLPGLDNQDPQIIRRMREVVSQFEILSDNPDRSEVYRKVLKKQMMMPRLAMIQQVNYEESQENQLHPIEAHRKSYIQSLAKAVKKKKPELILVQDIADHMFPYDPLVTYFAHQEVAELLKRTGDDPYYELQCRLHMIFYSNAHDRSVRNIVRAIELLADHPEIVKTTEDRFDLLNGLFQQLKYRWELRQSAPALKPEIALNDVKYSVEAIEQGIEAVDEILPVRNFSREDWSVRKKYLEKKLVRPLHSYRTSILPKHQERKSKLDTNRINESIQEELENLQPE